MARTPRQRGEMVCTVCQTRTSPLWRRGDKGEVLCNACGLYHKHHKKPRPISLANSSARTARRQNCINSLTNSHPKKTETKIPSNRYPNIYPNVMNNNIRPNYPFKTTIAPALTKVNATGINMSPTLQPAVFNTNANGPNTNTNGNSMYASSNASSMSTLSPTFKMTSTPSSMPIPIKKNIASSSVASPPLSHSLSPPLRTPPMLKMNNTNVPAGSNDRKLPMLPAPLAQKNNSEHYYNYNLPSLNMSEEDGQGRDDRMILSDEDAATPQYPNSKTSIASIMNQMDTPVNAHYNHDPHYNPIPTPLSNSPNMNYNHDQFNDYNNNSHFNDYNNSNNTNNNYDSPYDNNYHDQNFEFNSNSNNDYHHHDASFDHQDIEAAHLLISLRNEKVC